MELFESSEIRSACLRSESTRPGPKEDRSISGPGSVSRETRPWPTWSHCSDTPRAGCGAIPWPRSDNELARAGLELTTQTGTFDRDERFKINVCWEPVPEEQPGDANEGQDVSERRSSVRVELPDLFWLSALGLDRRRELEFLRPLGERSDPLVLHVPDETRSHAWAQGTWGKGLVAWAYHAAQCFVRRRYEFDSPRSEVRSLP